MVGRTLRRWCTISVLILLLFATTIIKSRKWWNPSEMTWKKKKWKPLWKAPQKINFGVSGGICQREWILQWRDWAVMRWVRNSRRRWCWISSGMNTRWWFWRMHWRTETASLLGKRKFKTLQISKAAVLLTFCDRRKMWLPERPNSPKWKNSLLSTKKTRIKSLWKTSLSTIKTIGPTQPPPSSTRLWTTSSTSTPILSSLNMFNLALLGTT